MEEIPLQKILFAKKKINFMAVGKMPFATLGNTAAYLFFSHAALEDKYEMLPTYCPRAVIVIFRTGEIRNGKFRPRDELQFIPRAVSG